MEDIRGTDDEGGEDDADDNDIFAAAPAAQADAAAGASVCAEAGAGDALGMAACGGGGGGTVCGGGGEELPSAACRNCGKMISLLALDDHEEECIYNRDTYHCDKCHLDIPLKDVEDHLVRWCHAELV